MEITQLLRRLPADEEAAMQELMPLVYDELKKLAHSHARRELAEMPPNAATALVHDAYLKLARGRHPLYENRAHFYGIASRLMRQILIDAARTRRAAKRGYGQEIAVASLPERPAAPRAGILALEDALLDLEREDALRARLIEMRFFGGMTAEESADALGIEVYVARRELRLARAWLQHELAAGEAEALPCPA